MKPTFTLILFILCVTSIFGQSVLKYDLKVGDTFTVKQNAEQIITQELDGAVHVLTNTLDGILEFTVLSEQKDNYEVDLKFKDLNLLMSSSLQGELMSVHAKEVSEEDMQSKIFNSLLDQPVKVTLSKTGAILKVTGGDSLVSRMASASGLEDDFSKNMMKKSLEKEFGSEALSNSYEQMTFIYAENEVAVGDTWQNTYQGKLSAQNTWTLKALEGDEMIIHGNAEVTMAIDDPATTMNLKGSQNTEVTSSRGSGFIKTMQVQSEAKGVSTMPSLGDQEIPTTIASTTNYVLIEE